MEFVCRQWPEMCVNTNGYFGVTCPECLHFYRTRQHESDQFNRTGYYPQPGCRAQREDAFLMLQQAFYDTPAKLSERMQNRLQEWSATLCQPRGSARSMRMF